MSVAKAQAAMTTPNAPSNIDAQRQGFFEQCTQFGTNAGAGDTSKVGWFQATVEAAWQGIIVPAGRRRKGDTTSPPTDPEIAYTNFAEARKKKAGELGKKIIGAEGKDYKIRVSEANRMITLGSLPLIHGKDQGGLGVFNRALKIIREEDEIVGQVDDMMLNVARRQCEMPDKPLTNAEIKALLMPDEDEGTQVEREEVELWGLVLRQIESIMNNKYPDTAGTAQDAKTARNSVVRRIDALGGTKAMVKAREEAKRKEEAAKAARKVERQGARGARRKKGK